MKIFYSYCHEDEKYRERLEKFLTSLCDSKKITEWHDRKINAGDEWQNNIRENLENSLNQLQKPFQENHHNFLYFQKIVQS